MRCDDFTHYYHSQLDRTQVCINQMLTHSFCNLNRDLIPEFSCVGYCSVVYIAAGLFWTVFKQLSETCLLWENIPVVQECNSSSAVALNLIVVCFLSLVGWWWLCLGADLFTAGAESDRCALSLEVRIKVIMDSPWLFIWKLWLGRQESICPLKHLGTLSFVPLLGGVPGFLSHLNSLLLGAVLAFGSLALAAFPVHPRCESPGPGNGQWIKDFSASHIIY